VNFNERYRSCSLQSRKRFFHLFCSGKLPPGLTIEDIKSGVVQSKPRNRLLAQVFKELGIIEKYGSGIKRVIEDFKAHGLKEPSFEEKQGGFYVVVSSRTNAVGADREIQGTTQKTQDTTQKTQGTTQETKDTTQKTQGTTQETKDTTQKTQSTTQKTQGTTQETKDTTQETKDTTQKTQDTTQSTTQKTKETTREIETEQKIIVLLKQDPRLSRKKLASSIGISENGIKYHLDKLKKRGKLLHVGPDKGGYWKITG
ncbi:MAG: winged helix-turn-helix transcriptional regulator, partial [Candidatus Aminicenantes bacterium]|nr:winged helix-turn-helix transcriptional regulator [Candidatus Aminicenantes bacterium]